jgi:hypothetical protein
MRIHCILSRGADALLCLSHAFYYYYQNVHVTTVLLPCYYHAATKCGVQCACLQLLTAYVVDGGGDRHCTEPPIVTHTLRLRPLLHAGP